MKLDLNKAVTNVKEKVGTVKQKVGNMSASVKTSVKEKAGTVKDKVGNMSASVKESVSDMKDKLVSVKDSVKERIAAEKTYSGMDLIPDGRASGNLTPGCLVLEGGAFRGLYTQGVLDFWMMHDLNISDVIGVSAGALSSTAYMSGQIGRSARVNIGYRHDTNYIGVGAIRRAHSPINLDFLIHDYDQIEPLDLERFNDPRRRLVAVATDCDTGEPSYLERGKCSDMFQAMKATASMPFIAPMVELDGRHYLDGGCSCNVPYRWAIDQGYEKIVVVLTHDATYKSDAEEKKTARRVYRRHQTFAEVLDKSNIRYNFEYNELYRLQKEGRIFIVQPSEVVTVGRVEGNLEKLGHLYWLGHKDAEASFEALKKYMGV